MNTLSLTEKQQDVLWLRYGNRASIDQIARWLGIKRRAVLYRLRNARRRSEQAGIPFPEWQVARAKGPKLRMVPASQVGLKRSAARLDLEQL